MFSIGIKGKSSILSGGVTMQSDVGEIIHNNFNTQDVLNLDITLANSILASLMQLYKRIIESCKENTIDKICLKKIRYIEFSTKTNDIIFIDRMNSFQRQIDEVEVLIEIFESVLKKEKGFYYYYLENEFYEKYNSKIRTCFNASTEFSFNSMEEKFISLLLGKDLITVCDKKIIATSKMKYLFLIH